MSLPYFQPHGPDLFVTSVRSFDFDLEAKCPRWMQFLDFVTVGDRNVVRTMQQFFASVFLRQVRHEYFLWLFGDGGNGKSVLVAVLCHVLGQRIVGNLSARQLAGTHELAGLADKSLNVSMEFGKITPAFIDVVKNLTSNEPVTINEKKKPVYHACLDVRLVFVSNSIPYVSDHSDGFWRRCLLVPCLARVPAGTRNLNLIEELKAESAGIFNWLLQGAVDLVKQHGRITVAPAIERAVEQRRRSMDPHKIFLTEELIETGHDQWLPGEKLLYPRYQKWMRDRGHSGKLSWESFKIKLRESYPHIESVRKRHPIVQGGRCHGYSGIFWRDAVEAQREYDEEMADRHARQQRDNALNDVKENVRTARSEVREQIRSEKTANNDKEIDAGQDLRGIFRKAGIQPVKKETVQKEETIPGVIWLLHTRYHKLLPSSHNFAEHRCLVIVIKGVHNVAINFSSPELFVGHKYRNRGPMEETPETHFKADDPNLFQQLTDFIERPVSEDEWKPIWPLATHESLDPADQKTIDDLLKEWSETNADDEPFNGGAGSQ